MRRFRPLAYGILLLGTTLCAPHPALAKDPLLFVDIDGLVVRAHLQAGLNGVAENNLFWNFAQTVAPSVNYKPDKQWLEGYVKPGLSFSKDLGDPLTAYGMVSIVASGTLGIDAYDVGNTGRVTLEEGYLGLRSGDEASPAFDVSLGPRVYKAGTGMLIANGGNSGFERGALKFGPRKAWKMAALARTSYDEFSGTAFYLQPNELPDTASNTQLVGFDLRRDWSPNSFAGVTYGHVLESTSPYPKAAFGGIGAPTIVPDGRSGLNFVDLYAVTTPFPDRFENFFTGGEFAYEWNDRIEMSAWAARFYVGYVFADLPWAPRLAYSFQTFSGDNPDTPQLERFDPLFYEGSPTSWSTGSKSSMVFINSNVNANQISLSVTPTERDTLTLRVAHIRANELQSPIQFGQGTRVETSGNVPSLIAGVTDYDLSDDVFLEYNRTINPNTFLTVGVSVSFPGRGIDSVIGAEAPNWTGGFANVVVNY